ncbi:hypothetical protein C2G38_2100452 [Gigaspora rosea]|uniref:Uncharacterized protein n=1 Tax=Gigaspora rosea TaxID=44941 RepID=A0A397UTY1_9GLOM|nr:hypothetical protein C2G38_2100452 [Gigaspora rosea]
MDFYDVLYELINMILHSSKGLKILEINGNEHRLNYRFRTLLIYALNKKNALVSLRLLNLIIGDIEEQKELVIALSNNTTLVSLHLSNNQFGKLAGKTLAPILLKNKTLTSLNFSNNRRELTIKGVEAFAYALSENTTLRSLTLSNDSLTREGGIILANALFKNKALKSLDLGRKYPFVNDYVCLNKIRMEGATKLASALRENKALTSLNLSGNRRKLGDFLRESSTLTTLDLSFNQYELEGRKALLHALGVNNSLTFLNLAGNGFYGHDGRTLAQSLITNVTLIALDISKNRFGAFDDAYGGQLLADALCVNNTLRWINISNNSLGKNGGYVFIKTLGKNNALTHLDLSYNQFNVKCRKALTEAYKSKVGNTTTPIISLAIHQKNWKKNVLQTAPKDFFASF